MSCPFYSRKLHWISPDDLRSVGIEDHDGLDDPLLAPNPGSNQCALVTDAHSPCIMQVEGKGPEWGCCVRNPVEKEGLMDEIILHAKDIYVTERIAREARTVSLDELRGSRAIAHAFRFLRAGHPARRNARPDSGMTGGGMTH